MKIDRLLGLTIYLLNHGKTSSSVLAEFFEVSQRTIIRDMENLCMAGIPICATSGPSGGYSIMDTFQLQKQLSNQEDIEYITCALQAFSTVYNNQKLNATLEKMKHMQQANTGKQANFMQLDFRVTKENDTCNQLLFLIHQCIQKQSGIDFWYTNANDERKHITVAPVCALYKWYAWYLIGYCMKHQDYRMYKLVRMEEAKEIKLSKQMTHDLQNILAQIEESIKTQETIHVELYCKKSIRTKCKEYLKGSIEEEFENGDFRYSFSVPFHETFWYGLILSFGSKAKVLAPVELVTRIKRDCLEVLNNYADEYE